MTPLRVLVVLGCTLAAQRLPPPQEVPEWKLIPELRIGSEEAEEYALTRINALAITEDGSMVVGQRVDRRLRVYDRDGRFVRWIGRPGDGPGEFRTTGAMNVRGDTLFALDGHRLHVYELAGRLIRTVAVRYEVGPGFSSGSLTSRTSTGHLVSVPALRVAAYRQDPSLRQPVLLLDERGVVLDTIGRLHMASGYLQLSLPGGRKMDAAVPFSFGLSKATPAPTGDFVVFIEQTLPAEDRPATVHVTTVTTSGDTLWSRPLTYRPVPIPNVIRDSIVDALVRSPQPGMQIQSDRVDAIRKQVPIPQYYPPIAEVDVGIDGRIWLRRYVRESTEWLVLDSAGMPLARVRGSETMRIHAADRNHVWATELDALDVPTLLRMRIDEQERTGPFGNEGTIR